MNEKANKGSELRLETMFDEESQNSFIQRKRVIFWSLFEEMSQTQKQFSKQVK